MFSAHHIMFLVRSIFSTETERPSFSKELFTWTFRASLLISESELTRLAADKLPKLLYIEPPVEFYSLKKHNQWSLNLTSVLMCVCVCVCVCVCACAGLEGRPYPASPFLTLIFLFNFFSDTTIWHQFLWSDRRSPSAPVPPPLTLPPRLKI